MNKSYRLVWSRVKDAWVTAAEIVTGKGGRRAVSVGRASATTADGQSGRGLRGASPAFFTALEPRFMFDGAAAATAVAAERPHADGARPDAANAEQGGHHHDLFTTPSGAPRETDNGNRSMSDLLGALAQHRVPGSRDGQERDHRGTGVLFVDPRVDDVRSLVAGVKPGIEVVFLDPNKDGVTQISDYLQSHTSISSIYIFSHGASGSIAIGTTSLDAATVTARSAEFNAWSASLTAHADILLYGCDVAAGSQGQGFIGTLARATGADVAASTDLTGAAAKGGNWTLEAATGTIEARSPLTRAAMAGYDAVMDGPTVTSIVRQAPTYDTTNADSVTFRVTFSEAVQGVTGNSFVFAPGSVGGATVQLVTAVAGSNGTQYDVLVGGLASGTTGTLNLDLAAGSGITGASAGHTPLSYSNPTGGNLVTDQTYTIDKSINAPVITGLQNSSGSQGDSGVSASDFITNVQNLKITGTADADNTVRVFLDGHSIGLATADGSGNWVLDYSGTAIATGNHTLTATASDVAGNTANTAQVQALVIDTTAPVITGGTTSDVIVTLTCTEASQLDTIHRAGPGAFTVTDATNSTTITVNSVAVDAATNTVMLTLSAPVTAGHAITVKYTDPGSGNAIQDTAGNRAATSVDLAVTNATNASNQAPTISGVSGATWYSKGDAPVSVFSGAPTLADSDDTYLESATVTITTNRNATDALSISGTLPTGITAASYDSSTGRLVLSGHATLADYQAALSQVHFQNTTGAALDTDRIITLTVNDGQVDSTTATRTMHVLGQAFSVGDTTTAYLLNGSGTYLYGVNLVMGSISNVLTNLPADSMNALGFSPVDGHLFASDNAGSGHKLIRINADGTTTVMATYSGSGNSPAASASLISADIGANGIMYLNESSGTKIYRFDTNPTSSTYGTWLSPLTVSGAVSSTAWVDMSINKNDGQIYAAGTGGSGGNPAALYRIDPTTGATTKIGNITGPSSNSFPMQYFDKNGFFYFTSGGSNPTIYRLDISNPSSPSTTAIGTTYTGSTLPTSGDAGRIVTIDLDYGDAPDSYHTTLASNGARQNLLGSETWLGTAPTAASDGSPTPNADGNANEDGIAGFNLLYQNANTYSVDVKVTNNGDAPTTLVGWIDFNHNGTFDTNEAASVTVPAHTVNGTVTLTWNNLSGLVQGDTYARFRIATPTTGTGAWGALGSDGNVSGTGHGATSLDSRSYGPLMDGEVEDYKITILAADTTAPYASIAAVSPDPRHDPAGQVAITFNNGNGGAPEAVTGVDIGDFTLTRNGTAVDISGLAVGGSGGNYTIDLSTVTNTAGDYVLTLNPPGGIKDAAGNVLANSPSVTFTIDTTAPVIDLAPSDAGTRDHAATSANGAAVSLDDNGDAATLVEASDQITQIAIQVGGLRDGAGEILTFGSTDVRADGTAAAQTNLTVGGISGVDIAYGNGVFTLTRNGGGEFTTAQAQEIIRDIQYRNDDTGSNLTNGDRTFSFTATDKAGVTATPAIATITVTGGSGTNGPLTPTVDPLYTNNITPTLTGTATVGAGDTLTVAVNGQTYTLGGHGAYDGNLSYDGPTHTWSLTIPNDLALSERTYPVTATVTDASSHASTDLTSNELVVDLTPPAAPTVVPQRTNNTTPTITGTANLAAGEYLTVDFNGHTYTEGDGYLTRTSTGWGLAVTSPLADGTYDVIAKAHDQAGNTRDDTTSNELIIDTIAPAAPALDLTDASDSGVSHSDDTTNDTTPTIRVTLNGSGATAPVAGDLVKLYEGTTQVGNATLTGTDIANGYVDITSSLLAVGTKSFSATVTDQTGNVSGSSPALPVLLDTAAPVFSSAAIDGATLVMTYGETGGSGFAGTTPAIGDFTVTRNGTSIGVTGVTVDTANNTVTLTLAAAVVSTDTVKVSYAAGADKIQDVAGNEAANLANRDVTNTTSPIPTQTVVITSVTDDVTPVTGIVADHGSTNDTAPDLAGTLSAGLHSGEAVVVYRDGVRVGEATVTGTTWTYADSGLSDGVTYSYTAQVENSGLHGTASNPYAITVDTTPPAVGVAAISTDSGVPADFRTNDQTLVINGTFDATDTHTLTVSFNGVTYTLNGAGPNDGKLTASGTTWTLDATYQTLAEGTYAVVATAADTAGNTAQASRNVVIDTTAPSTGTGATDVNIVAVNADTGASATDFITSDRTLVINGTFNHGDTNTLTVDFNGHTYTVGDSHLTTSGDSWSLDVQSTSLADGTYTAIARATDIAGNTAQASRNVVIDTQAPSTGTGTTDVNIVAISTDTGASATDFITSDRTLVINGIFNHGDTNTLTVDFNGHTYTVGDGHLTTSGDSWSLDVQSTSLADGTYAATARATDIAGNTAQASRAITVDTQAPSTGTGATDVNIVAISTDTGASATDFITSDRTLVINGTFNHSDTNTLTVDFNGHTYTVGDGHLTTSGDSWSLDVQSTSLADGTYTAIARATDIAGNTAQSSRDITVDATPPTIAINTIAGDDVINAAEHGGSVTIGGTTTGVENGLTVTVHLNGRDYTATVNNNTWTLNAPASDVAALADGGSYPVTADVSDRAGNAATQATRTVAVDIAAPAIAINTIAGDDVINAVEHGQSIAISGTTTGVEDGLTVTVHLNGRDYTATVNNNTWTLTAPASDVAALSDGGSYPVTADISDRAGNAATRASRTVNVDATPPTVAINTIAGDDAIDAVEHTQPLTISGTTTGVEDGRTVTVHLNGHDYTATVSGNTWSATVGAADVVVLADPTYTVRADVADRAGNPAVEASRVVAVNTTVGIGAADSTAASSATPVAPPVTGSLPPSVVVTAPASLLTSVFGALPPSRDVTAPADRGITLPDLPAPSTGLVVKGTDPSLPGDQGLYLTRTPSSQESLVNEISSFNLPNGMFRHSDASAVVKVEANLADGRPLPDWISFDTESGRFTAKPPQGSGGYMDIKVTARDQNGNMVSAQFLFHITEPKSGRSTAVDTGTPERGGAEGGTQKTAPADGAAGQGNGAPDGTRLGPRSDARDPAHPQRHAGRHFRGRPSLAEQMADQRSGMSAPAAARQAAPRQGINA